MTVMVNFYTYKFSMFNSFSEWRLFRRGKYEGRNGFSLGINGGSREDSIRKLGKKNLGLHQQEWVKRDTPLMKQHRKLREKVFKTKKEADIQEKDYKTKKEIFDSKERAIPSEVPRSYGYYLLLFIAAIGEFPFNLVAFRAINEAEILIWFISLIASIIFAVCLHQIAVAVAEGAFKKGFRNAYKTHPVPMAMMTVLGLLIIAFGILRKGFIQGTDAELASSGIQTYTSSTIVAISLGIFVLLVSLVAISQGMREEESNGTKDKKAYREAKEAYLRAKENLAQIEKKYERTKTTLEESRDKLIEIETERKQMLAIYRSEEDAYRDIVDIMISSYRNGYTQAYQKKNPGKSPIFITERFKDMDSKLEEKLPLLEEVDEKSKTL